MHFFSLLLFNPALHVTAPCASKPLTPALVVRWWLWLWLWVVFPRGSEPQLVFNPKPPPPLPLWPPFALFFFCCSLSASDGLPRANAAYVCVCVFLSVSVSLCLSLSL